MLGIAEWVNKCINEWNNLLGLYYISWTMLIVNKNEDYEDYESFMKISLYTGV